MIMYPSVDVVGAYFRDKETFCNQRIAKANWVHDAERVNQILNGTYYSIYPFHIEVCSTYVCNFNCPWCSCRESMKKEEKRRTMSKEELIRIIDQCKKHNVGIQWTGGEPFANPMMGEAIEYASRKAVKQCIFTNGSLLDLDVQKKILRSNLQFIRVSLNCADIKVHSEFHGNINEKISIKVLRNLESLCAHKISNKSDVQIGLSIVMGDANANVLSETLEYISQLVLKYPKSINFIIVRKVNLDIVDKSIYKENYTVQGTDFENQDIIEKLRKNDVNIVFPFDEKNVSQELCKCNYGCSFFSEISPDGDVFMCSDQYGNKEYRIGNIFKCDLESIWNSKYRHDVIARHRQCAINGKCPQFSRGRYCNSLIEQIEAFRENENMLCVEKWISDLADIIPKEEHTFFI